MYFQDLSPYSYLGIQNQMVNVGWLNPAQPVFGEGEVKESVVYKLRALARRPENLCRGLHVCEFCPRPSWTKDSEQRLNVWRMGREGNGELHIPGDGVTYVSPVLIVHYIVEHGYVPPAEYLAAVDQVDFGDVKRRNHDL